MLAAGLAGIEEQLEIPDPIEEDIFHMSERRRKELGIESLPANLGEAIVEFENSELMRRALGDHVYENLLKLKREEWDEYRVQVHPWELQRYYKIL